MSETKKKGLFARLREGLSKTRGNLTDKVDDLVKETRKIDEDFYEELEDILLLADCGMKATTAPKGRNAKEHGYPMHMCEILNQLEAPYYLERTSCNTPANVNKTKNAIKKAFQNQLEGKGFSLVEVVTGCPTNWGLDALGSLKFIEENMLPEYPLGVYRDRSKEA